MEKIGGLEAFVEQRASEMTEKEGEEYLETFEKYQNERLLQLALERVLGGYILSRNPDDEGLAAAERLVLVAYKGDTYLTVKKRTEEHPDANLPIWKAEPAQVHKVLKRALTLSDLEQHRKIAKASGIAYATKMSLYVDEHGARVDPPEVSLWTKELRTARLTMEDNLDEFEQRGLYVDDIIERIGMIEC